MIVLFLLFYFLLTATLLLKALDPETKAEHSTLQTNLIIGTVAVGVLVIIMIFIN